MYSKQDQLSKSKTSKKKMPTMAYKNYVDFVNERSNGICQGECSNKAQDIHHAVFGAGGRDDRYITAICRECHHEIHNGMDIDKKSALKLLFKSIGRENWRLYNAN